MLICFSANTLICQTDTLQTADNNNVSHDRYYKLFNEKPDHEIKHLFKINLSPLLVRRPTIAFEQKLGKNFSCETSVSYERYSYLLFFSDAFLFMDEDKYDKYYPNGHSFRGYETIKYYYNLNSRRLIHGKHTNGFEGNYFAVQMSAIYVNSGDQLNKNGTPLLKDNYYFTFLGFTYGLQRRIGNIGYIEPSIYFDALFKSNFEHPPVFNLGLKLKIGFAIESISNLHYMLKK
jgi:hypothetical protein